MGFRNPLTSLSGDQITPGTITGSIIQTAATGKRIVLTPNSPPELVGFPGLLAYTADAQETAGARIRTGVALDLIGGAGDQGFLELAAPQLNGHGTPSLTIYGNARTNPAPGTGSGKVYVYGDVAASGLLTLDGQPYANRAPVKTNQGIPAGGPFSNTAPAPYNSSAWTFVPTISGLLQLDAVLDVSQVTAGFGAFYVQATVNGVPGDIAYFFGGRQQITVPGDELRVRAGVAVPALLQVWCYSSAGSVQINSSFWRASVT